jgi:NAD(P)-dependent dehydrogenase (short-subunit alcohol dehydrogenase family)
VNDLTGVVAVVTGAGNGIGRAVALELGGAGMRVAVADLDGDAADSVANEVRALGVASVGVQTDVRSLDAVVGLADQVEAELGPVRLLVNNAGVGLIEPIVSITDEDWHWVMDVNFYGVINGVQAFLPRMLAAGGEGHIVNTASMSGLSTTRDLGGYNASKYAVVGLTEAMRDELADHGIGVSLLCPGVVGTGIMGRSRKLRSLQSRPPGPLGRTPEQGEWSEVRIVSPEATAKLVLHGIQSNAFYLFTHPESRQDVEGRFGRILAGFDDCAAWAEHQ